MKFLKVVLVAGLVFYGIYWVSTTGVALWQTQKVQDAVEEYREDEDYYPLALSELTEVRRVDGQRERYLMELPVPREGHCWDYDKDDGRVQLRRLDDDKRSTSSRVCP